MKKSKSIAIIPARGGSKRIPKKNIKFFLGKPIIAYSIEAALKSNLFSTVMVSTDDENIAKIARKYGAEVPFLRSKNNADDYAILSDVINEVLQDYDSHFDYVCCLLATAPFVSADDLLLYYNKLINSNFHSVFPVVPYSFPIQRAMQFNGDKIELIWPENKVKRSQDLKPSYHDAGLFYWIRTSVFLQEKTIWTDNTAAIEISEQRAQDIDTEEDWKMAEFKFKLLHNGI